MGACKLLTGVTVLHNRNHSSSVGEDSRTMAQPVTDALLLTPIVRIIVVGVRQCPSVSSGLNPCFYSVQCVLETFPKTNQIMPRACIHVLCRKWGSTVVFALPKLDHELHS